MDLESKLILTLLIVFCVLYIMFNIDDIRNGDIFNSDSQYRKPLIIALIVTLVYYLYATWDKKDKESYSYRIANKKLGINSSNKMDCSCDNSEDNKSIFIGSRQLFGVGY